MGKELKTKVDTHLIQANKPWIKEIISSINTYHFYNFYINYLMIKYCHFY
jgi:hypothetical protein